MIQGKPYSFNKVLMGSSSFDGTVFYFYDVLSCVSKALYISPVSLRPVDIERQHQYSVKAAKKASHTSLIEYKSLQNGMQCNPILAWLHYFHWEKCCKHYHRIDAVLFTDMFMLNVNWHSVTDARWLPWSHLWVRHLLSAWFPTWRLVAFLLRVYGIILERKAKREYFLIFVVTQCKHNSEIEALIPSRVRFRINIIEP